MALRDDPSPRRQWVLRTTLSSQRNGAAVREPAGDAGVAVKTIRRDLNLFREIGITLEETTGEFGRKTWKIEGSGNLPALSFNFKEAAALYLARRSLLPFAGTLIWDAPQRAPRKVRPTLSESVLDDLDRLGGQLHFTTFGASDCARHGESIDAIATACEDGKAIHILYQSDKATELAGRNVYANGMAWHRGSLYLIALDRRQDKRRAAGQTWFLSLRRRDKNHV